MNHCENLLNSLQAIALDTFSILNNYKKFNECMKIKKTCTRNISKFHIHKTSTHPRYLHVTETVNMNYIHQEC